MFLDVLKALLKLSFTVGGGADRIRYTADGRLVNTFTIKRVSSEGLRQVRRDTTHRKVLENPQQIQWILCIFVSWECRWGSYISLVGLLLKEHKCFAFGYVRIFKRTVAFTMPHHCGSFLCLLTRVLFLGWRLSWGYRCCVVARRGLGSGFWCPRARGKNFGPGGARRWRGKQQWCPSCSAYSWGIFPAGFV